ncbi:MAG: site-specific integrase [Chloroflexi bacterium]|nr:site-specific integrase [Chloroflexota bacterium]
MDGAELVTFLEACNGTPYRTLFELDAATGLRRSELLALAWKDIDLLGCALIVRRSMHVLKGGKITFAEPKSARSRRTVALTPRMALAMRAYHDKQEAAMNEIGKTLTDDDLVFLYADGMPMLPDGISTAFKKIARRCGLSDVHLHCLRHSHASILLKQGVNIKAISERLGHSSTSFTLDTYSHLLPGLAEKAALAFDDAMAQANAPEQVVRTVG